MPDGTLYTSTAALDPFNTANNTPISVMETRTIKSNDYRVLTSGDLTYTIIPGLEAKTLASVYATYSTALDFAKRSSFKDGDVNRGVFTNRLYIDLLSENTLNYTKKIGDHNISALAGFTVQKTKIKDEQTTGLDFPDDNIQTLNTALQIDLSKDATYNLKNQIGLVSYLGRVTYGYKNKYLLTASYRRDGSSYFAPGNKWGNFPAISLGWIASEEKFLSDVKWVNNLKFRASYGVTGNNRIADFAYVDLLYAANYSFGSGTGAYTSGQSPSNPPGSATAILSNPDITWERTFQFNGGLDASLFKNFLSISLDVYNSETDRLLLRQSALGITGYSQK